MLAFAETKGKTREKRDLAVYLGVRFLATMAAMVQSVAVGWQIYGISKSPLSLGLIGLAQWVPMFLVTLPAGELCDRIPPRKVLGVGLALQAACSGALLGLSFLPANGAGAFYGVMMLLGVARGVADPAEQAILPFLVTAERLPRAISWSSSLWQIAVIAGPAGGGLLSALGPAAAYGACVAALAASSIGAAVLRGRTAAPCQRTHLPGRMERIREGVRFVGANPVVLGAISLDLAAVLFGGATALLPLYARDILHAGAAGLGLLRSAPAVGACAVALWQVWRPAVRHAGAALFVAVAAYGAATVGFGLSRSFPLSLAFLCALGAADMVSVNIRCTLIHLATPDEMRGRVSAVNLLFIGASGELGEFESGVTAALAGAVPAVVAGGIATVLVAALWMKRFPGLRQLDG